MHLSTWRWKKEKAAEMSSSISLSTVLLGIFSSPNPNQHSTPIVPTHQHQHTNEKNISLVQEKKKKKAFSRREATGFGFSLALLDALAQANSTAIAAEEAQCALTIAPSGLAFCDRVVGTGAEATKGQLIKAHYVGMLENGKVFDSSYSRGKALTFRVGVGEVIKGWDQGILGGEGVPPMLAGGKRTLKLPPQLGYGMRGAGCKGGSCIIPPDSVLVFVVEFIGKA